jgi:uncharacterized protein with von Willebrand factor type A (vWA) domain
MDASLASAALDFCALLREEHEFTLGRAQAHDILRAAEVIGIVDRARFKVALRAVCCSRAQEIAIFDRVFDDYFSSGTAGVAQPNHARRYRPQSSGAPPQERQSSFELESDSPADRWEAMRARYSPSAAAAHPPQLPGENFDRALVLVNRLMARLRLGRSRRWRSQPRGPRIDVRATIRASLQTGGDIIELRRLAHPLRNPRFVVLVDASRSMNEYAGSALQVAYALCRRTRRAHIFVFSTALREVTRDLRAIPREGTHRLEGIGDAWGGGTRIGASLRAFVQTFRSKLDAHTYVIVVSDGLDVGEIADLEYAMREISRRAAAVAWVNPHAAEPGFEPTARGMQAVLPFITTLTTLGGLAHA